MLRRIPLTMVLLLWGDLPLMAQGRSCPEFQVNIQTAGSQLRPAVASSPTGDCLVVWTSPSDGDGQGIFGRRYDASGTPRGSPGGCANAARAAARY